MKNKTLRTVRDYIFIAVGAFISSLGFASFLIPNQIAPGGATGLGTILHHLFGLPTGAVIFALNIPLLYFLWKRNGWNALIRTTYGALLFSVFIDLVGAMVPVWTTDAFLACIYGGVLSGVGTGIIFSFRGSTGGSGLLARLVCQSFGISVGKMILIIDATVIIIAGIIFNVESALYAMITVFIAGKIVDVMEDGFSYNKAVLIFCSEPEKMSRELIEKVSRGVTSFPCKGMYTGGHREALLCVVSQGEIAHLRHVVYELEPRAFLVVSNCNEVLGEGFRGLHEKVKNN